MNENIRDRPFNLQGGLWGFFFRTTQELEFFFFCHAKHKFFFLEFNIRLYDKNSESDYFFFLHQNQNIFLEKKHNPPLQVKWSFHKHLLNLLIYHIS